jgi:ParB family transcriptional regulator, chromosome partitioning protein
MPVYKKGSDGCEGRSNTFNFAADALNIITDKTHALYDPRVDLPVPEWLVKSIIKHGIIEPVVIVPDKTTKQPIVVDGRQRVKACRVANEQLVEAGESPYLIPCVLRRGSEEDLASVSVAANEMRQDDDVVTKAQRALRLCNMDIPASEIADDFGVTTVTIKSWIKLAECSRFLQKKVQNDEMSVSAAIEMSAMPVTEQKETFKKAIEEQGKKPTRKNAKGKITVRKAKKATGKGGQHHRMKLTEIKSAHENETLMLEVCADALAFQTDGHDPEDIVKYVFLMGLRHSAGLPRKLPNEVTEKPADF